MKIELKLRRIHWLDGTLTVEIDDSSLTGTELLSVLSRGNAHIDPYSNRVLSIPDIGKKVGKHPKTVRSWGDRKRDPLPLVRLPGQHPYMLECDLYKWFARQNRLTYRTVFGS
jgi:hypothetical protein